MKLPQFSLRDLFWLVLVCGLAVLAAGLAWGWWHERAAHAETRKAFLRSEAKKTRWIEMLLDYVEVDEETGGFKPRSTAD